MTAPNLVRSMHQTGRPPRRVLDVSFALILPPPPGPPSFAASSGLVDPPHHHHHLALSLSLSLSIALPVLPQVAAQLQRDQMLFNAPEVVKALAGCKTQEECIVELRQLPRHLPNEHGRESLRSRKPKKQPDGTWVANR